MLNVAEALNAAKTKTDIRPTHVCRASEIGHPCEKYLYYAITTWEKRKAVNPTLASIFAEGILHEGETIRAMMAAGYTVVEGQRAFSITGRDGKTVLTGHVDGFVYKQDDGEKPVPFEIKSLSPVNYDALTNYDKILYSPRDYIRRYPAQMTIYLLASNSEAGMLILKNKVTGLYRQINVALDWKYAEELVARAERVMAAVAAKAPPTACPEVDRCFDCSFNPICDEPMAATVALEFCDDAMLDDLLEKRAAIKAEIAEVAGALENQYNIVDEKIKAIVGDRTKLTVGRWLITVSDIPAGVSPRKAYKRFNIKAFGDV